jgi:hypothetical protein
MTALAHEVAPSIEVAPRELYVRHARRNGRLVVTMRALDYGDVCVVDAHIGGEDAATPATRTYRFADARQATAFVTEAVEALMYLGCEIHA